MLDKFKNSNLLYFIWLLFLPPMVIELLSGSTPPRLYVNPFTMLSFTISYGMVFTLLRELKVRWHLTWQFIFLVPIIGIYIEGFFMQSFFNPGHMDLGHLSNLGILWGIQWPWSIYLTMMHSIYSLIIPLYIIDKIFPKMKDIPILSKKTTFIFSGFILALTIFQLFLIVKKIDVMYYNYTINFQKNMALLLVLAILLLLAYLSRNIQLKTVDQLYKPKVIQHAYGFIYMLLLFLATHLFAEINVFLVVVSQSILIFIVIIYFFKHIFKVNNSQKQELALFNGTLSFFCFFAILQGFNLVKNPDGTYGMHYVGFAFIILMIIVNIKVLAVTNK